MRYLQEVSANLNKWPIKCLFWIRAVIDLVFKAETKAFDLKPVDRSEPDRLLFAEEAAAFQSS